MVLPQSGNGRYCWWDGFWKSQLQPEWQVPHMHFQFLDMHHTIIYMHIFATDGGCFEEKENEPADFVETTNLPDTNISNPDPVSPQPQTISNFPVSTGKFFAPRMFFATSYPLCIANFLSVVTFFLSNQPKFK